MSTHEELTCKEFIECIREGGAKKEKCAEKFYRQFFGFVYKLARKYNLPVNEVVSIYSEAVAILVHRIENGKFELNAFKACSTFVYQIAINLCSSLKKKNKKFNSSEIPLENIDADINIFESGDINSEENIDPNINIFNQEDINSGELYESIIKDVLSDNDNEKDIGLLRKCLDNLKITHKKVLLDWASGYSMEEIAERNGLKNANSASVIKHSCLKKLKKCYNKHKGK